MPRRSTGSRPRSCSRATLRSVRRLGHRRHGRAHRRSGREANGADTLVRSSGTLTFAGTIAAEAIAGGTGDTVRLESATDLVLSGDITQGGQTAPDNVDGAIEVFGCSVTLTGGASLTNTGRAA